MLKDELPSGTATNVRFCLSVLRRALDRGTPDVPRGQQSWLELNYDEGQGLLMLVDEIDRAVGELVEALSDAEGKDATA